MNPNQTMPPAAAFISGRTLAAEREKQQQKQQKASISSSSSSSSSLLLEKGLWTIERHENDIGDERKCTPRTKIPSFLPEHWSPSNKQVESPSSSPVSRDSVRAERKENTTDDGDSSNDNNKQEYQKRVSKIRNMIRTEIEKRIKLKCNDIPCSDPRRQEGCHAKAVASMSLRVESQLYHGRDSLESYANLATLDDRLQSLAMLGLHRRHIRQYKGQQQQERTETLARCVGGIGKYRQIQKLLQEICNERQNILMNRIMGDTTTVGNKDIGMVSSSSDNDGTEHQYGYRSAGTETELSLMEETETIAAEEEDLLSLCPCTDTSTNGSNKQKSSLHELQDQNMPKPVYDLFFGCTHQLAHAFDKTPKERLHLVDWKLLITRNQTVLRNFREWNGDVVL